MQEKLINDNIRQARVIAAVEGQRNDALIKQIDMSVRIDELEGEIKRCYAEIEKLSANQKDPEPEIPTMSANDTKVRKPRAKPKPRTKK